MSRLSGEFLAGGEYRAAGDSAFVIQFGDTINGALLAQVSRLDQHIQRLDAAGRLPGLVESVPTFRSLAVLFDPLLTRPSELLEVIAESPAQSNDRSTSDAPDIANPAPDTARHWSLPVLYGGVHGPDLEELATAAALPIDELIARHESQTLVAYMLGFLPGFAFLGDIDGSLQQPRRQTPRTRVPAGSVAVANALSAIYPWESPGGWHLIGHCPVPMFNASWATPTLLQANDRVSFFRVNETEHDQWVSAISRDGFDTHQFLRT